MERKNTGQLSLACTGNLRDNRQPRRLGSVLPSSNAKTHENPVNFFMVNSQVFLEVFNGIFMAKCKEIFMVSHPEKGMKKALKKPLKSP